MSSLRDNTVTVMKVLGQRPEAVPAEHIIFNAPRPMYGEQWTGDFLHGRFFSSLDPSDDFFPGFFKGNVENDGWICEYVDRETVIQWAKEWLAEMKAKHAQAYLDVKLDDFDFIDLWNSWYRRFGRRDVPLSDYLK